MSLDYSKGTVMLEFNTVSAKSPTVADIKRTFKLADDEIDATYGGKGFVGVPDENGKYNFIAVISTEAGKRIQKNPPAGFVQIWPNSPIGPM